MFEDDSYDDSEVDLEDDSIDVDLFFENVGETVLGDINRVAASGWFSHVEKDVGKKVSDDQEQDYAFDELLSKEVEKGGRRYPVFNPETDFSRKINLKVGFIFPNVEILRAGVQQHAVENKYDFFLYTITVQALILFVWIDVISVHGIRNVL